MFETHWESALYHRQDTYISETAIHTSQRYSTFKIQINLRAKLGKTRETKAEEYSDSDRFLICASQAEMLEKFEEYKIKTNSGWRCIKSNALFGK